MARRSASAIRRSFSASRASTVPATRTRLGQLLPDGSPGPPRAARASSARRGARSASRRGRARGARGRSGAGRRGVRGRRRCRRSPAAAGGRRAHRGAASRPGRPSRCRAGRRSGRCGCARPGRCAPTRRRGGCAGRPRSAFHARCGSPRASDHTGLQGIYRSHARDARTWRPGDPATAPRAREPRTVDGCADPSVGGSLRPTRRAYRGATPPPRRCGPVRPVWRAPGEAQPAAWEAGQSRAEASAPPFRGGAGHLAIRRARSPAMESTPVH